MRTFTFGVAGAAGGDWAGRTVAAVRSRRAARPTGSMDRVSFLATSPEVTKRPRTPRAPRSITLGRTRRRLGTPGPAPTGPSGSGQGPIVGLEPGCIEREARGKSAHLALDLGQTGVVLHVLEGPGDEPAHLLHIRLPHPPGGEGGGADPDPGGHHGGVGVVGDGVLVDGDPRPVRSE